MSYKKGKKFEKKGVEPQKEPIGVKPETKPLGVEPQKEPIDPPKESPKEER